MPDIKWIKINTEMFDDEKIRIIEAMPEADTLIVIWIRLICIAGKVNAGGHIYLSPELPYDEEQLAAVFNRPLNTVRLALETFRRLQMIEMTESGTLFLPKFKKHQSIEGMERVRESARLRMVEFRKREKRKLLGVGNDATSRDVTVTPQIRIEKNRKEEEKKWNNILNKLQNMVNRPNFNNWLKDTVVMEINDFEIIIGVQREDQASYIENTMRSIIESCILEETEVPLKLRLVLIEV